MIKNIINYKWCISDYIIIGAFTLFALFIYLKGIDVPYTWNWSMAIGYLFFIDETTGEFHQGVLIIGLINTFRLFFISILIGTLFGFVLCFMRLSKNKGLNLLGAGYVNFVRNIPPLVFLFIFYFFISQQIFPKLGLTDQLLENSAVLSWIFGESLFGISIISAGICLGLFESVFFAEIIRGAMNSIPSGQTDASRSLGFSWWQRMSKIIIPQALVKSYPALAGQFIVALKNTSIASLVSVKDLIFSGVEITTSTRSIFEAWIVVAIIYFIMCYSLAKFFARWEKKLTNQV